MGSGYERLRRRKINLTGESLARFNLSYTYTLSVAQAPQQKDPGYPNRSKVAMLLPAILLPEARQPALLHLLDIIQIHKVI